MGGGPRTFGGPWPGEKMGTWRQPPMGPREAPFKKPFEAPSQQGSEAEAIIDPSPEAATKEDEVPAAESKEAEVEEKTPEADSTVDGGGVMSEVKDPELSARLKEMMEPLFCRLCSVKLNAIQQAHQHYKGKNHAKKVRSFVVSGGMPNPSPVVKTVTDTTVSKDGDKSGDSTSTSDQSSDKPAEESSESGGITPDIYCKICDVSFTSCKQSEQHYQGKNHAKKLRVASAAGTLGPNDMWVKGEGNLYECVMCSVHVTSQDQLTMHFNGAKHKAKLRLQNRASQPRGAWRGGRGGGRGGYWGGREQERPHWAPGPPGEPGFQTLPRDGALGPSPRGRGVFKRPYPCPVDPELGPPGRGRFGRSRSDYGAKRPRPEFLNYRTPSGSFYCSYCNTSTATEGQFAQHINSRRHKTNIAVSAYENSQT